jgi:hypothetical protein
VGQQGIGLFFIFFALNAVLPCLNNQIGLFSDPKDFENRKMTRKKNGALVARFMRSKQSGYSGA